MNLGLKILNDSQPALRAAPSKPIERRAVELFERAPGPPRGLQDHRDVLQDGPARHAFGTHWVNRAPIELVQKAMRLADIRTTQGYIDYKAEDIEEAARRIHIR